MKIIIFGNSGSGKSTLASSLASDNKLAHMDLDTIAWRPSSPPTRTPIKQSQEQIDLFVAQNKNWVIEGCYADLIELVISEATEVIFLNLPVHTCVENAKARLWEPHKYDSKEAQDANLPMLLDWIEQYEDRTDTFSKKAHMKLYTEFTGRKKEYTSNRQRTYQNP